MFSIIEDAGKRFAKGAKKEILKPKKSEIDWDKIIKAGTALLELGIFAIAMFSGGKSNAESGKIVVINNYH